MDTLRKTFHWVEKTAYSTWKFWIKRKNKSKNSKKKNDRNGQMSVVDKTRFK